MFRRDLRGAPGVDPNSVFASVADDADGRDGVAGVVTARLGSVCLVLDFALDVNFVDLTEAGRVLPWLFLGSVNFETESFRLRGVSFASIRMTTFVGELFGLSFFVSFSLWMEEC